MTAQLRIPVLDVCIIVAYILLVLFIGVLTSRKTKVTSQVFFLAGRSLPWGVVGAALFASNISTIHLVGLTASGYNEGLVWGNFEWMASFTLILLALVFWNEDIARPRGPFLLSWRFWPPFSFISG
jgi:SSS family solute:Na+ symporter